MPRRRNHKRRFKSNKKGLNRKQSHQVKRMINADAETKFADDTLNIPSLVASTVQSGALSSGMLIPEGLGSNERIGSQVKMIGVSCRTEILVVNPALVRIIQVLFDEPTTASTDMDTAFKAMTILSHLPKNIQAYRILSDRTYSLDPDGKDRIMIKKYIKLYGRVQKYDGATANDQQTFDLVDYYITDNTTASKVIIDVNYRTYWKD